jgi:hypothetical protein
MLAAARPSANGSARSPTSNEVTGGVTETALFEGETLRRRQIAAVIP